jgi:hypothetical protein
VKALILVLSARTPPWGALLAASLETWDEPNDHTCTRYYCGNTALPDHPEFVSRSKVFHSALDESLENVSARTIEAFERSLEMPEWDFLARPNSSCYVHKPSLVAHLETLPRTDILHGLLAYPGTPDRLLWGGGQFLMSRDVVERFVAYKNQWRRDLMEDASITRLAEALQIPIGQGNVASINPSVNGGGLWFCIQYGIGESFYFTDFAEVASKAAGQYFFRCKQDEDRTKDVMIFRELKKVLT